MDKDADQATEQQAAVPPPKIAQPGSEWAPPEPVAPEPTPASQAASISLPHPVAQANWDTPKEDHGPHEEHDPDADYSFVRPYFWTGGRTTPRVHLAVEALVSATGREAGRVTRPEHRAILGLCATPHSVAELAAMLKVPLGVARVLLGDLAAAGSVVVHRTAGSADAAPDIALMQRVLAGLRRL